jgi:triacylglycerol lipase
VPSRQANDGMVPVLSQVWGRVVHAARADHLDVMGYFREPGDVRHVDWLASGAGFRRSAFEDLWRRIAGFIASGS